MAEHGEKNFEHELEAKLRKLDENIRIPEIPDAQSIFEKAEQSKKVVPFIKYAKYIATAAAVVLICVSVPALAGTFSVKFAEPESADIANEAVMESYMFDSTAFTEEEVPAVSENDGATEPEEDKKASDINGTVAKTGQVKKALESFFAMNSVESSSSVSEEIDPITGGNGGEDISYSTVDSIVEQINSKRSIEISVEDDSVSVILNDDSANEVITAFWVEGQYVSSVMEDDSYVVNIAKKVFLEELEEDYYLPMVGDMFFGTYTIPEEEISVAERVAEGIIMIVIEINIGSGEYVIKASLV